MNRVETQAVSIANGSNDIIVHRVLPGFDENEIHPLLRRKLVAQDELEGLGNFLRARNTEIVFMTGVYDMLHMGHMLFLQVGVDLAGDYNNLVVGLNSNKSVQALKGPDRPIQDEQERATMLAFNPGIAYITMFDQPNGADIIRRLKPNGYLCVEGSWEGEFADLGAKAEVKAMAEVGGIVYCAPRQSNKVSTSETIARIEKQYGRRVKNDVLRILGQGEEDR